MKSLDEVEKIEVENTYSSSQAADYLGLTELEFNRYEVKSTLCYHLQRGRRMYSEKVLIRFRREVLDRV